MVRRMADERRFRMFDEEYPCCTDWRFTGVGDAQLRVALAAVQRASGGA
jgi:hypothetical protein